MRNPQITGLKTSTCLLEIHHGTMCLLYTDGLGMATLMCILETWRKNKTEQLCASTISNSAIAVHQRPNQKGLCLR